MKNKSFSKWELDLSNHATKSDLKNAAAGDISKFAIELNLAILKLDVEKLFKYFKIYVDKLN